MKRCDSRLYPNEYRISINFNREEILNLKSISINFFFRIFGRCVYLFSFFFFHKIVDTFLRSNRRFIHCYPHSSPPLPPNLKVFTWPKVNDEFSLKIDKQLANCATIPFENFPFSFTARVSARLIKPPFTPKNY